MILRGEIEINLRVNAITPQIDLAEPWVMTGQYLYLVSHNFEVSSLNNLETGEIIRMDLVQSASPVDVMMSHLVNVAVSSRFKPKI